MIRWLLTPAALLVTFASGFAADLARVDRTIGKEPKYSGQPRYGLLVFGPDAGDRVWLVRDGDTLYADKHGNGDLTEAGDRIAAEKDSSSVAYHVGTVRLGKAEHRNVTVRASALSGYGEGVVSHPVARAALKKDKNVDLMSVSAEVSVPGLKGGGDDGRVMVLARIDANGPLLFADTAADAPVLHLGGPLQIHGEVAKPTLYRNVVHDLMLTVGTPGSGPGTFTHVLYEKLIPREAVVVVEAEFAPAKPGDPPLKQKYELKERC